MIRTKMFLGLYSRPPILENYRISRVDAKCCSEAIVAATLEQQEAQTPSQRAG